MKTRLLWTLILAVAAPALYFGITRPHVSSIPRDLREPIDELKPAALPPLEAPTLVIPELPTIAIPPLPAIRPAMPITPAANTPEVPIQNQATIDFSTGAPVVRRHGKDQEALESALKEMAEVIKDAKIEASDADLKVKLLDGRSELHWLTEMLSPVGSVRHLVGAKDAPTAIGE